MAADGFSADARFAVADLAIHVATSANDGPRLTLPGATYRTEPCVSQDGRVSITQPTQPGAVERQCRRVISVDTLAGTEDQPVSLAGLAVADPDLGQTFGAVIELSLSATRGRVIIPPAASSGASFVASGNRTLTFRAPLDIANRALAAATYLGDPHYYGTDMITIKADDLGFTGTGGPQTDTQTLPIRLLPVNNPPTIRVRDGLRVVRVFEDFKMLLPAVTVADPDWDAQLAYFGHHLANCTRDDVACQRDTYVRCVSLCEPLSVANNPAPRTVLLRHG